MGVSWGSNENTNNRQCLQGVSGVDQVGADTEGDRHCFHRNQREERASEVREGLRRRPSVSPSRHEREAACGLTLVIVKPGTCLKTRRNACGWSSEL